MEQQRETLIASPHLPPVFKADVVEAEDGGQDDEERLQDGWKASQLRSQASCSRQEVYQAFSEQAESKLQQGNFVTKVLKETDRKVVEPVVVVHDEEAKRLVLAGRRALV